MSPTNPRIPKQETVVSRLGTEFGTVLQAMVVNTPGALGAVLSDEQGDAIDFAHNPADMSEIDVQLLAAQIGQTVLKLDPIYTKHHLRAASLLVESEQQCLVASALAGTYVLAMLLERRGNVAAALTKFATARAQLATLL